MDVEAAEDATWACSVQGLRGKVTRTYAAGIMEAPHDIAVEVLPPIDSNSQIDLPSTSRAASRTDITGTEVQVQPPSLHTA